MDALAKSGRTIIGTAILRWLFGITFLFVAFGEFPDHKWSIGLGLIVFNFGIGTLAELARGFHLEANRLADLAERKTRHAILLAAERRHIELGRVGVLERCK